jgi:hypothetical protein
VLNESRGVLAVRPIGRQMCGQSHELLGVELQWLLTVDNRGVDVSDRGSFLAGDVVNGNRVARLALVRRPAIARGYYAWARNHSPEHRDELPPSRHSITSSALSRIDCGNHKSKHLGGF